MSPSAEAVVAEWKRWIDPRYLQAPVLEELRTRFAIRPRRPLSLPSFLAAERAAELAAALRRIRRWDRVHTVLDEEERLREISAGEWGARPAEERWSAQELARPLATVVDDAERLDERGREQLAALFDFVIVGVAFRTWLGQIAGVPLGPHVSCELVRYRRGDFIARHTDTHDARIVGLNLYLDADYRRQDGGQLGYANEEQDEFSVDPAFNSLSLIPIDRACCHWVGPWKAGRPGRETVSLSFSPAA
ncbi:MAG: 2OG-Fe(II) oxygenase family protein [Solirubrobacterales bacterium]